MTDTPGQGGPTEEDLGPPIAELQELRDPVPEGFGDRIRNAIHRRSLAGDLTRFTLWAPAAVFLEFLASLFSWLGSVQEPPRDAPDDAPGTDAETEDVQ